MPKSKKLISSASQVNRGVFLLTLIVLIGYHAFTVKAQAAEAEMIWALGNGDTSKILISLYRNGKWQGRQLVEEDDQLYILPALGSHPNGKRLAVWVSVDSNGKSVLKYCFKEDGKWQASGILTDIYLVNLAPVIVFDTTGKPYVLWSANDGEDDDIFMSTLRNNRWTKPILINEENDVPDIFPGAGIDDGQNVWVGWQQLNSDGQYEEQFKLVTSEMGTSGQRRTTKGNKKIRINKDLSSYDLEMPSFFYGKSRATIHFPKDRKNQSITLKGSKRDVANEAN